MACPKPSYECSVFGFSAHPPPPGLALANVQPHRRLHVVNTHPPPPSIIPHRCFTRRARNRATNAQFLGFWLNPRPLASRWRMCSPTTASMSSPRTHHLLASPQTAVSHSMPETELQMLGFRIFGSTPAPWPRVGERAAPLPPPCYQLAPTTSHHHPVLPFHMAPPKPSHKHSVSGFQPKPRPPASCWQTHGPPLSRHVINPHLPPPTINLHSRFTRHARAFVLSLFVFLLFIYLFVCLLFPCR